MPILSDIKNALGFVRRGEFKELLFRLRVHFGKLDLSYASVRDLGLSPERSHDYRHSGGVHLDQVMESLEITENDAIVDFGAGKGGALITFAKYPFAKITGVELLPGLAAIARNNFKILGLSTITMIVCDAAEFTDLDEYTYFYFYSPFPADVMAAVMDNIGSSLRRKPRRAQVIYCNPEFPHTVTRDGSFVKTGEFHHRQLGLPIHLYSHTP